MPTSHTLGTASKIVVPYVVCRIFISIVTVAAFFTGELALRSSVSLVDVETPGTPLGRVTCIHKLDRDSLERGFVGKEALQLRKAPIAHSSSLGPASLCAISNIGQVFHHQRISWLACGNYPLCDHVVSILLKSFQSARQLLQVSFRRFCTFALKLPSQAKVAVIGLFDVLAAKVERVRGHRQSVHAQINTDGVFGWCDKRNGARNNHVQPECPVAIKQISTFLLPVRGQVPLIVSGCLDRDDHAVDFLPFLLSMQKGNDAGSAIKPEGAGVIANGTQLARGGLGKFEGFDGLASFLSFLASTLVCLYLLFAERDHALDRLRKNRK